MLFYWCIIFNCLLHSDGGFLSFREEITGSHAQGGAFSPVLGSRILSYVDDDTAVERNIYDLPDYSEPTSSPAPQVSNYSHEYTNEIVFFINDNY